MSAENEQRARAEQFARDYNWEDTQPRIEDPDYAASEILSELDDGSWSPLELEILSQELVESAKRENARRNESERGS